MSKKTYSEKLKDPRWQKRRLEIMERDHFTCRVCMSEERTLHVHHRWYEKGVEPWDYSSLALATVCDKCHRLAEIKDQMILALFSDYQLQKKFMSMIESLSQHSGDDFGENQFILENIIEVALSLNDTEKEPA